MNIAALLKRARIVSRIRSFFDERGFIEVETPVRIAAPAPETNIDCPPVATGGFLRASPELQMKKLLALGMEKIYQIGPCFRDGEKGSRHNPEFTMIEWYRRDSSYLNIKDDITELMRTLLAEFAPELEARFQEITVCEAYLKYAHWDPWIENDHDRFDFDMATKIEPAIKAMGGGVFLMDYPPWAASLSRLRGDVAERWELYWNGVELANCFSELNDSKEQLKRFEIAREERRELGEADYPIDMEFINSVEAMGLASGVALGIDRLVMALLNISDISLVRVL
ncbi:MAG: EF-P lysine aminoacylase GenX [Kiritimatiellae bacterium]|nr:EF-P lysine aminoacylase GenX [Kiritimatiellia bacterium]